MGRALPSDWAVPLVDGGAVRLRDMWNAYDALETAPSPLVTEETLARAEGAHPPLRCHPAPPLPPRAAPNPRRTGSPPKPPSPDGPALPLTAPCAARRTATVRSALSPRQASRQCIYMVA